MSSLRPRVDSAYDSPMTIVSSAVPRFVVFEGVDGIGKSTFAKGLAEIFRACFPETQVLASAFPGSTAGTLGNLVYKLHHGLLDGAPKPSSIAGPALQLLHVAAHVDAIMRELEPVFAAGGSVILDRYWWSTYAYVRRFVPEPTAWSVIGAETPFWTGLPSPEVIYLRRRQSLKPEDLDHLERVEIAGYYEEVAKAQQTAGIRVVTIDNDDGIEHTWEQILSALHLEHHPLHVVPDFDDHK